MRFQLIHIFQVKIQPSLREEIYPLAIQYQTEEGKNVPTKVGVRYPGQMLEDIKRVLNASTEMSKNLKKESAKIMNILKKRIN